MENETKLVIERLIEAIKNNHIDCEQLIEAINNDNVDLNPIVQAVNKPDWLMLGITFLSVLISGVLSWQLVRVGKKQNTIQQNNLKIQMHEKYFDIYEALTADLCQFLNISNKFHTALGGKYTNDLENSKVEGVIAKAKQLLPSKDFDYLFQFKNSYSNIIRNFSKVCNYVCQCDTTVRDSLRKVLNDKGILGLFEFLNEKTSQDYFVECKKNMEEIHSLLSTGFKERIQEYSDLSSIVVSAQDENFFGRIKKWLKNIFRR